MAPENGPFWEERIVFQSSFFQKRTIKFAGVYLTNPNKLHSGNMENGPFEDVFAIEHGDIPASYVIVYQRVYRKKTAWSP